MADLTEVVVGQEVALSYNNGTYFLPVKRVTTTLIYLEIPEDHKFFCFAETKFKKVTGRAVGDYAAFSSVPKIDLVDLEKKQAILDRMEHERMVECLGRVEKKHFRNMDLEKLRRIFDAIYGN
jgi:hypothetical protein